jgi:hypothetical protein
MTRRELFALAPALMVAGCDSETETRKEKAAEPVTGLHALVALYGKARLWAPDIKVVSYVSLRIDQVKDQPGKSPVWQVVFGSEAEGKRRAYTYSVAEASTTIHKGIFEDAPAEWSSDNRAIPMSVLQVDTDQAWATALKNGGDYPKQNPKMPIAWSLEMGRLAQQPVWRVIWGESVTSSSFSILIDATNGKYLATLR